MELKPVAVVGMLLSFSGVALASDQDGTVTYYGGEPNDVSPYVIMLSGPRTTKPACATDDG